MRGLNKLYYLKIDIENIQEEIRSIPTISSPQITGMPHGSDISNPTLSYVLKKEALIEKLNQKMEKYTEEAESSATNRLFHCFPRSIHDHHSMLG